MPNRDDVPEALLERPELLVCRAERIAKVSAIRLHGLRAEPIVAPRLDALPTDDRRAAIKAARAGEPLEVEFTARTFVQGDPDRLGYEPNRKGVRFKRTKMRKLSRSFPGVPFLIDHREWMSSSRMGTVLASELGEDDNGDQYFRQDVRATKPMAVEGILDGTMDRFSIAWDPTGPVLCSAHRTPVGTECECWPLDTITLDGQEKTVEYEFTDARARELSTVVVPAVLHTRIEDVRVAALAALRRLNARF